MTDAERKLLGEIARESRDTPMRHVDQMFLLDLVRREATRADLAEQSAKDVARDCLKIVHEQFGNHIASARVADVLHRGFVVAEACQAIEQQIIERFSANAGPTLTDRITAEVALRCMEIAEQVALDTETGDAETRALAALAIREVFGFAAGVRPDGEYIVRSRFVMSPTPSELDAASGFAAILDEQTAQTNAQWHEDHTAR